MYRMIARNEREERERNEEKRKHAHGHLASIVLTPFISEDD